MQPKKGEKQGKNTDFAESYEKLRSQTEKKKHVKNHSDSGISTVVCKLSMS